MASSLFKSTNEKWRVNGRVRCEESIHPQSSSGEFHVQSFFASQTELLGLGQPMSLGLVSGFCSGYFLKKVGKVAVVSGGVVFLLFQAAAQKEYLTVNWPKVDHDFNLLVNKYSRKSPESASGIDQRLGGVLGEFARLCTEKTGLTSGAFMAGLMLGLRKG